VIHHTAVGTSEAIAILSGRDPSRRVSAHFLVTDESPPRVLSLVPEDRVAFHAGASFWDGLGGLNEVSVGIEVVNPDGNVHAYPEAQVTALARLIRELVARHGIGPRKILAHSDIAPTRKIDPGSLFPWEQLHREHGIGTWPSATALEAEDERPGSEPPAKLRELLSLWGYPVGSGPAWDTADRAALIAFQRRYRPARVDGQPDAETVRRLRALLATYPR
jgi:N-acetyl-anhydromuramyl-L-alanine amidase AmpD